MLLAVHAYQEGRDIHNLLAHPAKQSRSDASSQLTSHLQQAMSNPDASVCQARQLPADDD